MAIMRLIKCDDQDTLLHLVKNVIKIYRKCHQRIMLAIRYLNKIDNK